MVKNNAIKCLAGPFYGDKTDIFETVVFGSVLSVLVNQIEISVIRYLISVFSCFSPPLLKPKCQFVFRYLPPDYADGISVPRQREDGTFLRSPREISVAVHSDSDR